MVSNPLDQRKAAIESRFAAEKQRTETRYDKQIESLLRRKEAELDTISRRKQNELQRLDSAIEQTKKLRPENSKLQLLVFQFEDDKQKEICCQDSYEYFRFFGSECRKFNNSVNASKDCKFSELFSLIPCSSLNQQENSKFCKFSGFDCIAQKFFSSFCSDKEAIPGCDVKRLSCADGVTMIDEIN